VQNIAVTDTYTVTPHLLLNSWFGWNQQNGGSLSGAPFCLPAAGVNIAQTTPCEISIGVAGGFNIQRNDLGAFNRGSQTFREDITLIKGGHELHFGGEALRIRAPMSGIGADLERLLFALRAILPRNVLPFGAHTRIHTLLVLFRQVQPLNANVHNLNAVLRQRGGVKTTSMTTHCVSNSYYLGSFFGMLANKVG
jgi:hypothetical protein